MIIKWIHTTKWDRKFGKIKHTYTASCGGAYVLAINGMGRAEWHWYNEFGYAASVKEAKGILIAKFVARRMTR